MAGILSRVLLAIALIVVVPRSTSASPTSFLPNAKMDATRPDFNSNDYRVWGISTAAGLVSRYDTPNLANSSTWVYHGNGGSVPNTSSVAAVGYSYFNGSVFIRIEDAYYLGVDGNIYEGEIQSELPITWRAFAPPAGVTLTGNLAAAYYSYNSTNYITLLASATDNNVYVLTRVASPGQTPTWTKIGGYTWVTTTPWTATVNAAGTVPSFFGAM